LNPLAPTFVQFGGDTAKKSMTWPLRYELPGSEQLDTSVDALEQLRQQIISKNGQEYDGMFDIVVVPEQIVAVGRFTEFIVESVVRKVHEQLLTLCTIDGLKATDTTSTNRITFAQYDAVYSMGKRRSEVHIPLQQHPW
jgi:SOUL heme-binding protein